MSLEQKTNLGLEMMAVARSLTQVGGKLKLQGSRRETYFVPLDLNVFFLFFFHKETEKENQKKKIKIWGNYPQRFKVS